MRRMVLLGAVLACVAAVASAQTPPPPPIPTLPTGPHTSCTMKGPAWVLYGVHNPNGPPRHGNRYLVHAWGITCTKAKQYLKAFFPKIPPHPMGTLRGGPKGFKCKGRDAPGTVTKSKPHDGSCLRLKPAATFDWEPTGGTVG